MLKPRRQMYNDIAPTLRQLCEDRQMLTIHGNIPQSCLRFVKKINTGMTCQCSANILASNSDHRFSLIL